VRFETDRADAISCAAAGADAQGGMETVGNLSSLGCVDSGAFGVEPVVIAADDFHPRMLAQPRRQRGAGAIRQHVGNGSGLEIHEDGSICRASTPGPLINATNPPFPSSALSLRPMLEMPENRIAAHHDAKLDEHLREGSHPAPWPITARISAMASH
jgi:hypothetical protein